MPLELYPERKTLQYIPRIMHTIRVLLCFDNSWFYPYISGLLHWHFTGNHSPSSNGATSRMWVNTLRNIHNHNKTKHIKTAHKFNMHAYDAASMKNTPNWDIILNKMAVLFNILNHVVPIRHVSVLCKNLDVCVIAQFYKSMWKLCTDYQIMYTVLNVA